MQNLTNEKHIPSKMYESLSSILEDYCMPIMSIIVSCYLLLYFWFLAIHDLGPFYSKM